MLGRVPCALCLQLSPVPEQHNISPAPASEAAADDKQRTRRHLFKSLSQQQHRTLSSSDGRQLSVLLLPGVTCEAATTAATAVPGQQLQTHSVPSSPIQGNLTLVTRSLSLQRASAQPAVVPLQQASGPMCIGLVARIRSIRDNL